MILKSGIYQILNKSNGHRYVGSATNLARRKTLHFCNLKYNRHFNEHLQYAYKKYGREIFEFSTLFYCDKKDLILFEQRAVDILKPEYNISPIAGSPMAGRHHTIESRKKISESGKIISPEIKERHHLGMLGNTNSKGKKWSDEARKRLSKIRKGMKMPPRSKEHIRKLILGHLGKKQSPETCLKRSQSLNIAPGLSGYKNIHKHGKNWRAIKYENGHKINIGTFSTIELAKEALDGRK